MCFFFLCTNLASRAISFWLPYDFPIQVLTNKPNLSLLKTFQNHFGGALSMSVESRLRGFFLKKCCRVREHRKQLQNNNNDAPRQ